jgi:hypothetical protein
MKIEFDSWDIEKALEEHLEKHYNLKVNLQDQELAPILEVQLYELEKDKEGNSVPNYSKPIKNKREYTEIIQESWISFYIN